MQASPASQLAQKTAFLLQALSEAPLLHVHVTYWPFLSIKVLNLHKGDLA